MSARRSAAENWAALVQSRSTSVSGTWFCVCTMRFSACGSALENGFGNPENSGSRTRASKNKPGSYRAGIRRIINACPPSEVRPALCVNAALSRAKDGEDRTSAVEPIFGDLIKSLDMRALIKLLAKMRPVRRARSAKTNFLKSETTFLPNLI